MKKTLLYFVTACIITGAYAQAGTTTVNDTAGFFNKKNATVNYPGAPATSA